MDLYEIDFPNERINQKLNPEARIYTRRSPHSLKSPGPFSKGGLGRKGVEVRSAAATP